jgi:NAD(P)-dependent dehydrogenase (short-subunit alcohol dehydrogenase family)
LKSYHKQFEAKPNAETKHMNGLQDSVAIVTGGSSGIGQAAAERFAAEGARVVVADIDTEGGTETVAAIEEAGGEATFVETDVAREGDNEAMVETAIEEYGGLDMAFNNAGIEGDTEATTDQSVDNWERVIKVNLDSVFYGMRAEIPAMLADGGGAIVNTSSIAGLRGLPKATPYSASKHGVLGLTKTAAAEFGRSGVRVNAVCPGVIETPMVDRAGEESDVLDRAVAASPMQRMGQPEEVGDAVVWLCSDEASFITGESLAIDGGYNSV